MMEITIRGDPRTKKNSMKPVYAGGRFRLVPSPAYTAYRNIALMQITGRYRHQISTPVNVQCVYYMATKHKVDLLNLMGATCDILVDAGVLLDDNSRIVVSHDGSRVLYDKDNPRVEITITEVN